PLASAGAPAAPAASVCVGAARGVAVGAAGGLLSQSPGNSLVAERNSATGARGRAEVVSE
ncbi:MAG: hypothetical protein DIU75_022920, partial [Mycolicibacterium hassiacum]